MTDNPIKDEFDRLNISTRAVSLLVGISQPTVSRHVSGVNIPNEKSLYAYAKALNIPIRELKAWARKEKKRRAKLTADKNILTKTPGR